MDYFTRYGLEFNPFIKNSKEILVDTAEYKEALFRLDYLAKTKGFGLLTGSPGRGKTTVIRKWAKELNPSLYRVVYSSLSTLTANDFYRNLVRELGAEPAYKKPDNFRIIQEEITRLSVEKRKTPSKRICLLHQIAILIIRKAGCSIQCIGRRLHVMELIVSISSGTL